MHNSIDLVLAATLRRLRHERGATQEDVAYQAGITVASLSRIERGYANPGWTTVRRIINHGLKVSLTELAQEVEDAPV